MINGIIVVHKAQDFTSHDVVAKMRGICKQKKIGHTGTLDPNATGVLPVCLGNATKLCDLMNDPTKEYIADFRLGLSTDTQDIWGNLLCDTGERWKDLDEAHIREVILSFKGPQLQIPPMYSAKKVQGKKLYELAREGVVVDREACPIEVYDLEILAVRLPDIQIRVSCSKGTYIRTICHDIGEKLGCCAVMTALKRTKAAGFDISEAYTLDELQSLKEEGKLETVVLPTERCFSKYEEVMCNENGSRMLRNGNQLSLDDTNCTEKLLKSIKKQDKPYVRVYDDSHTFYGVYEVDDKHNMKPWKMFMPC